MTHFSSGSPPVPLLAHRGQSLKGFVLQAMGARPRICAYCDSTIPVGDTRCCSCNAAVTDATPTIDEGQSANRPWIVPLLLCTIFPPALFILVPALFWRWLRKGNTGWILPSLICLFFPPAVLLVAPALFWRSPKSSNTT